MGGRLRVKRNLKRGFSFYLLKLVGKIPESLVLLYSLALTALVSIFIVCVVNDIPAFTFMRDPSSIARMPPYIGLISNVGVLLWCASSAICLFSAVTLRHRNGRVAFARYFFYWGTLTSLLMLDDLFLFHENLFPRYLGIPETITFGAYTTLICAGIFIFKDCVLLTDYKALMIACCLFGLSLFVDFFQSAIQSLLGEWRILLEDGFKFFGIVSWFGYFSRACFLEVATLKSAEPACHAEVTAGTP